MTRTASQLAVAAAAVLLTILTFQQIIVVPAGPSPVTAVALA